MHFKPHDFGSLKVSLLINGALALGLTDFEHHHGLVGPSTRFNERFVRLGIDEDVVEHVMVHRHQTGVVTHVEPGGEIHPLPIVLRQFHLTVTGVLGRRRHGVLRAAEREPGT